MVVRHQSPGQASSRPRAAGIPITPGITLRNGQRVPPPEIEMKAAAGDAALEEISTVGRLRLLRAADDAAQGFDIASLLVCRATTRPELVLDEAGPAGVRLEDAAPHGSFTSVPIGGLLETAKTSTHHAPLPSLATKRCHRSGSLNRSTTPP